MIQITCPACAYSYPTADDNAPDTGQVLTCVHCAHIAVWDADAWRDPTPDEHAALLRDPNFLDLLAIGMEMRAHVALDRDRMAAIIAKHLDCWVTSGPGTAALAGEIADDAVKHGFHTHQRSE